MADWLLDVELGWGMPHWILAVPGLLVLGVHDLEAAIGHCHARRHG